VKISSVRRGEIGEGGGELSGGVGVGRWLRGGLCLSVLGPSTTRKEGTQGRPRCGRADWLRTWKPVHARDAFAGALKCLESSMGLGLAQSYTTRHMNNPYGISFLVAYVSLIWFQIRVCCVDTRY